MLIGIDASRANARYKSGVEWYAYHLIQELKKIIPADITVRLYSREPLEGDLAVLPRNWESAVLRWLPRFFWTIVRFSYELSRRPPDLLFVPAGALPFFLPRRTVTTVHDIGFFVVPRAYPHHERAYLRYTTSRAMRLARRIFTISESSKRDIMARYSVPTDRITVTPLAHDALSYHAAPRSDDAVVRQRYGLGWPYFVFIGRLDDKKNIAMMVQSFQRFARGATAPPHLVLVGRRGYGGNAVDHVERAIRPLIHELPWVAEDDLPAIVRGARALLFVTRYEGFGIPILEGMASGVPVIASAGGAHAEVAQDAAVLVPADDVVAMATAMQQIVSDMPLRERLRRAGQARAAEFSWERTARATWDAIIGSA